MEKACVWPVETNGYCVQHARMFEEGASGRYAAVRLPNVPDRQINSTVRQASAHLTWEKGQKATHILIMRELFDWRAKAPYVLSGFSTYGALEYCKSTKELRCHECGEWYKGVSQHIKKVHMEPREYKIKHGFTVRRGLLTPEQVKGKQENQRGRISPGFKGSRFSAHEARELAAEARDAIYKVREQFGSLIINPETANMLGKCRAQREQQLMQLYQRLGHRPSHKELLTVVAADGTTPLRHSNLLWLFGISASKLMDKLRMDAVYKSPQQEAKMKAMGWKAEAVA